MSNKLLHRKNYSLALAFSAEQGVKCQSSMSDLRRKLELRIDPDQGLVLDLDDWDHRDYIEDVLAEHFDIDYEYLVEDEKSGRYTLYFCDSTKEINIQNAVDAINKHHSSSSKLYETI